MSEQSYDHQMGPLGRKTSQDGNTEQIRLRSLKRKREKKRRKKGPEKFDAIYDNVKTNFGFI